MKRMNKILLLLLIPILTAVVSCKSAVSKMGTDERPTRGHIRIGVDESYQLLAKAEIDAFEAIYTNAEIEPVYASEDSILNLFLNDSVRLMITSRPLTENEVVYLKQDLIIARTTKIAYDAIAFVVNQSNPDRTIRYHSIRDIFLGRITSWKQINPESPLNGIKVVFDESGSGNVRTIMEKFNIDSLPDYCYVTGSNPLVIDYVENDAGAIGIIGVNWISDVDDSITHSFLNRVKVLGITSEFFSESSEYYQPHPAYIADESYPFIREVYMISRETFAGLGGGFIAFVAGDSGQRILLKMGMLPATIPVRLVQLSNEF
ncbi:MAG: substrate-binding domain-containing protein [Bacteroidales bacterium]|nr:substrate-binding domain-containing protein [Bacteroidales bacterium]